MSRTIDANRSAGAATDAVSRDAGDEDDAPNPRDWLAAIIDGSDDAIISKDLTGNIRSWNHGATRLFGFGPEEAIGRPVTMLIPDDRLDEEPVILAEIRAGNRVEHFETMRRRKDGALVDISLTISPIRNQQGLIVGASKIARDITERREAQMQQNLLIGEMNHRVKNLFAVASAIVSLSMRSAASPDEVPQAIQGRLASLARAHDLTMANWQGEEGGSRPATSFLALIRTLLAPYDAPGRICVTGANPLVGGKALSNLALLLHEFATNAAKYGSLSVAGGRLAVHVLEEGDSVQVCWTETDGPATLVRNSAGFGSYLERGLTTALGASIRRDWKETGLVASLTIPRARLGA